MGGGLLRSQAVIDAQGEEVLRRRWMRLVSGYSTDHKQLESLFDRIVEHHSEPHRAYHTLSHLAALFTDLDRFQVHSIPTEFAVWFHDIIYRPGSGRNESRSAAFAQQALKQTGVVEAIRSRVSYLIECTKKHENPLGDSDAQYFLDADMAILGASPEAYGLYMDGVRREFSAVPAIIYRRGRKRFLKAAAAADRIYDTPPFYEAYESQARLNIARELESLS